MGMRYALPLRMTLISRFQMMVRTVQTGEDMYAAACLTVSRRERSGATVLWTETDRDRRIAHL